MAFVSIKSLLAQHALATPEQFDTWKKAWQMAVEGGSGDSLLSFIARERGVSEEVFLQQLGTAMGWPFVDLKKIEVSTEARQKVSTKVAFQYSIIPTKFENGTLEIAVSNPFDSGMLSSIQFDARCPVQFALSPKVEIEKALKKYYGVGAETLD